MIRIAVTGPESCGKTSLAEEMARALNTEFIPEFSREYLTNLNRKYTFEDLDVIAQGQLNAVNQFNGNDFLIADTDMVVMYIWSMVVYGKVSPFIETELKKQQFDLYVLCDTDVPWSFDPLRENEYDRDDLFRQYYKKLRELKYHFVVVNGTPQERLQKVLDAVAGLQK